MTAGLVLYRLTAPLLELFARWAFARRIRAGKEASDRLPERFGTASQPRPPGVLIWMHAASVGETLIHVQLIRSLRAVTAGRPFRVLLTTQTLTGAQMARDRLGPDDLHQMAPIDTPGPVTRFLDHWRPDVFVLAESEFWASALLALKKRGTPRLLVNARMRARSIAGWARRAGALRAMLGGFRFIGAADRRTAAGLARILGRPVNTVGNLKLDQPAPSMTADLVREVARLRQGAFKDRPVLLAASTHPGEDALLIGSFRAVQADMPGLALILAPRHPERGEELAALLLRAGLRSARRSVGEVPGPDTEVLLADTIGDMPGWLSLARAVYLGGGHAEGVGGHNPIEAARLGLPVVSGPKVENFADVFEDFVELGAVTLTEGATLTPALRDALSRGPQPMSPALQDYLAAARAPAEATLQALVAALPDA